MYRKKPIRKRKAKQKAKRKARPISITTSSSRQQSQKRHRRSEERIVGGVEVNPPCPDCKYPFMASIQFSIHAPPNSPHFDYTHGVCGGSLIHPEWVLTAAHCADPTDGIHPSTSFPPEDWSHSTEIYKTVEAILGLHRRSGTEGSVIYETDEIIIHPDYVNNSHYNDLALLHLVQPADIRFEPLTLISNEAYGYEPYTVIEMGWGSDFEGNPEDYPEHEPLPHVGTDELMETLPPLSIVDGGASWDSSFDPVFHITAVSTDPDNPYAGGCFGDSGGPMIVDIGESNYEIVGSLSFGTEFCNQYERPSIYTRIWPYKTWIENTIQSYIYSSGDVNQDTNIDIADIIFIVNGIFNSFTDWTEEQLLLADINNDGIIDIGDIISLINIILSDPQTTSTERQQLQRQLNRLEW